MVVLRVVAGITQEAVEGDETRRLAHRRSELRGILRGAQADERSRPQVGLPVADDRELWPMEADVPFLASSPDEVTADVTAFQPGGVRGRFGLTSKELQPASATEDISLKNSEGSFFKRRSWA
jgi:hypothetical protein